MRFTKAGSRAIIRYKIHANDMPELPEIETIRRGLTKTVLGKPVLGVCVKNAAVLRNGKKKFMAAVEGRRISDIRRRGKMLIFALADGKGGATGEYLIARLGMTGRLLWLDRKDAAHGLKDNDAPSPRHCHVIFRFEGDGALFFCDTRRFGYLEIVDEAGLRRKLAEFGPEPLSEELSSADFAGIARGKKTNIKALLLNQKYIAGIGNIYADEILFAAGVAPDRPADSLSENELGKIYRAMRKILKRAIENRGTTFSDYVDAAGSKGNNQNFLKVYGRSGEKCPRCGGTIRKMRLAGRGTSYCPKCQE